MKQGIIHRCVLEVVDGTCLAAKLNIGLITEKVYVDQYHHHRWSYLLPVQQKITERGYHEPAKSTSTNYNRFIASIQS